jgi:hypothetical protein
MQKTWFSKIVLIENQPKRIVASMLDTGRGGGIYEGQTGILTRER